MKRLGKVQNEWCFEAFIRPSRVCPVHNLLRISQWPSSKCEPKPNADQPAPISKYVYIGTLYKRQSSCIIFLLRTIIMDWGGGVFVEHNRTNLWCHCGHYPGIHWWLAQSRGPSTGEMWHHKWHHIPSQLPREHNQTTVLLDKNLFKFFEKTKQTNNHIITITLSMATLIHLF